MDISFPSATTVGLQDLLHAAQPSAASGRGAHWCACEELMTTALLLAAGTTAEKKKRKKGLKGLLKKVAGGANDLLKVADPVSLISNAVKPLLEKIPGAARFVDGLSAGGLLSSGLLTEARTMLDQMAQGDYSLRSIIDAAADAGRRALLALSITG